MSHSIVRTSLASLAVAAALVLAGAAIPASAATGAHCAIGAEPTTSAELATKAKATPVEVHCFATDDQMWTFLTGDATVNIDTSSASVESAAAEFNLDASEGAVSLAAAASVILGIESDSSGYGGQSLTLYASSGTGCGSGATYGFPSMSNYGWNDRIGSASAFSGCRSQHYDNSSYGGGSITCSPNCYSMGSLDNRTSSIVFRP